MCQFEGWRLKSKVLSRWIGENKTKVNVNDMSVRVQQNVAVVTTKQQYPTIRLAFRLCISVTHTTCARGDHATVFTSTMFTWATYHIVHCCDQQQGSPLRGSHMSAGMPSEWKFVVHSLTVEVHSKNSDWILCAFQIFGHILVTRQNVLLMRKTFEVHSKKKYRTVFEVYSNCTFAAF